jgi:hypothetical protein
MAGVHQQDPQVGYNSPYTAPERIAKAYATFSEDIPMFQTRLQIVAVSLVQC